MRRIFHVSIFVMNLDKMCTEELAEINDKYRIKVNNKVIYERE